MIPCFKGHWVTFLTMHKKGENDLKEDILQLFFSSGTSGDWFCISASHTPWCLLFDLALVKQIKKKDKIDCSTEHQLGSDYVSMKQ